NPIRLNHALSNYRAVAGPTTYPFFSPDLDMGGVMYQNSRIRIETIKDGTSNTLAVGEVMFEPLDPLTGNSLVTGLPAKRACIGVGMTGLRPAPQIPPTTVNWIWISDVMWWVDDATATINGPAPQAFSSRHTGGAFFGFCDGSVRFFRDGLDPSVVKWLAGRDAAV